MHISVPINMHACIRLDRTHASSHTCVYAQGSACMRMHCLQQACACKHTMCMHAPALHNNACMHAERGGETVREGRETY